MLLIHHLILLRKSTLNEEISGDSAGAVEASQEKLASEAPKTDEISKKEPDHREDITHILKRAEDAHTKLREGVNEDGTPLTRSQRLDLKV